MSALVNIHVEQCRDYAWTQNRIKDLISAIRKYYSLNCSARYAIIKKLENLCEKRNQHALAVPLNFWTHLTEFVFLNILI